jgi:hypothetical protein
MKFKTKQTIFSALAFLIILGGTILAGSLIPTGPVGTPTMYTLSDIYNKLTIPSYTSTPTHSVSTTSLPTSGTMNTLSEIWSAIPSYLTGDTSNATSTRSGTTLTLTIPRGISDGTATLSTTSAGLIAGNILASANVFGLTGTANDATTFASGHVIALADKIIDGYSAFGADGLVIDGTGSAGAPALQWSADDPTGYVAWATAGAYCTGLGGGYRLPHMWELAQYFQQNGQSGFQGGYYWSSTDNLPYDPGYAYYVNMSNGYVSSYGKSFPFGYARCAR